MKMGHFFFIVTLLFLFRIDAMEREDEAFRDRMQKIAEYKKRNAEARQRETETEYRERDQKRPRHEAAPTATEDIDVNWRDADGNNVLHKAARSGNADRIKMLIEDYHMDVNGLTNRRATPLMLAAQAGHTDAVRLLIEHGANVNAVGEGGMSSLMLAAAKGHYDVLQALIAAHANVNVAATDGTTPLYWATRGGHIAMMQLLMLNGADTIATLTLINNRLRQLPPVAANQIDTHAAERKMLMGMEEMIDQALEQLQKIINDEVQRRAARRESENKEKKEVQARYLEEEKKLAAAHERDMIDLLNESMRDFILKNGNVVVAEWRDISKIMQQKLNPLMEQLRVLAQRSGGDTAATTQAVFDALWAHIKDIFEASSQERIAVDVRKLMADFFAKMMKAAAEVKEQRRHDEDEGSASTAVKIRQPKMIIEPSTIKPIHMKKRHRGEEEISSTSIPVS